MQTSESQKQFARRVVRDAIKQGKLSRPEACSVCKQHPGLASDGRSKIHAHHHDYSKPLDVEWLCAKCHRKETPLPKIIGAPCYGEKNGMRKNPLAISGSKNGQSKLTESQVVDIKTLKGFSVKQIAEKFGVSACTVYDILRGKRWVHVKVSDQPK